MSMKQDTDDRAHELAMLAASALLDPEVATLTVSTSEGMGSAFADVYNAAYKKVMDAETK